MIVKPICAAYDVNRKFGFNATEAITIEHEEDFKTRFIDLFLYENNIKNAVDVSGATVTARMVTTPEFDSLLLNDNVSCSIGEKQGHIVVPIDKAVLPSYPCEFLVEIHIENGEDVLVLPFPLWVKMNASILDDAGVTPESKGTVPELLEEATQALEAAEEAIEESDSHYHSIQEELNGKEDKANKVTKITDDNTAAQYPTAVAVKNYANDKVEEAKQYFPEMVDSDITSEIESFVTGKFVKNDGTIRSSPDFKRTGFIDISEYKKLKIHTAYGYQAVMVAFYSGQTFASFIDFEGENDGSIVEPEGDVSVDIPEGANYAIINCLISAESRFKVIGVYEQEVTIKNKLREIVESQSSYEIKANKASEITPQPLNSDNEKYPSVTAARNYVDEGIETVRIYHYDSVDVNYTINERHYCNSSGSILGSDYYDCTEFFDISGFAKLVITSKYGGSQAGLIAFFDNEDNIVGYINDQQTLAAATKEINLSSYKSDGAVKAIVNCARSATEFKILGVRDVTIENKLKQVSDKADCITDLTGKKIYVGGDSIMYGHGSGGYAIGEYLSEKYSMVLTKGAETGATLSTSFDKSICTRMCALDAEDELKLVGDFDVIIFDGGVNDKSKGYELGSLTNNFEDNFDTTKAIGALEKICRRLVLDYPNAKKLFIISNEMTTSSYSTNKPQIEYMEALIPVLNKWGIPYVNMLHTSIKAFNAAYNSTYFYQNDKLHPNLSGYKTFYFGKIEQALLFGSTDSTTVKKETSIAGANIRLSRTNFVYDGSSHVPNVSAVTLNGQTLISGVDYVVVSAPATNAGTYVITINGMGNYSGTATANWTISKAQAAISGDDSILISGVGNSLTKTYTTDGDGAFSFSLSSNIATLSNTGGAVTVTAVSVGSGNITVSVAEGQNYLGATKTVSLTIDDSSTANVFGVMWDYSLSSPELTRLTPQTDPLNVVTAVPTQEPTACIGTEGGQSDFDNFNPWAGMQRFNYVNGQIVDFVDYSNGETYVYIPEFWSKIVDDSANQKMYFYICDSELNGFEKHLGSGRYIGRYPCDSNFKSTPNGEPKHRTSISNFRTGVTALDNKHYLIDIHSFSAIQLLYIIEFANLNSQSKIGEGLTNVSQIQNLGLTDVLTYHTGRTAGVNYQSAVHYRWVENLWGNVSEYVDGILTSGTKVYFCDDYTHYDNVINSFYYDTNLELPNLNNEFIATESCFSNGYLLPKTIGASSTTYTCDRIFLALGIRVMRVGGIFNSTNAAGIFAVSYSDSPTDTPTNCCGRPILILNTGGNS